MTGSGLLRTPVTVEVRTESSRDSLNNPTFTWSTWREIFAAVEARAGKEQWDPSTRQRFSETVFRITVRALDVAGINAGDYRLTVDGTIHDIRQLLPDVARSDFAIIETTVADGTA